jgi:hypothetical protein
MPQLGTCDQCGREVPRKDLVRKLRPYGYDCSGGGGVNHLRNITAGVLPFPYVGRVSMGRYVDNFTTSISGTTVTEGNGSYTLNSPAIVRSYNIDVSAFTNVFFGVDCGAYHAQSVQQFNMTIGCCDVSLTPIAGTDLTRVVKGQRFVWWSRLPAALTAAGVDLTETYFYLSSDMVTGSKWWYDGLIVCDAGAPPLWQPKNNSAAAVVNTGKGFIYLTPALCPKCVDERLLKPSEDKGKPRFAEPVAIRSQIESL